MPIGSRSSVGHANPVPVHVRPASPADVSFLAEMLVAATFWRSDGMTGSVQDVRKQPELAHYVLGWPRASFRALLMACAAPRRSAPTSVRSMRRKPGSETRHRRQGYLAGSVGAPEHLESVRRPRCAGRPRRTAHPLTPMQSRWRLGAGRTWRTTAVQQCVTSRTRRHTVRWWGAIRHSRASRGHCAHLGVRAARSRGGVAGTFAITSVRRECRSVRRGRGVPVLVRFMPVMCAADPVSAALVSHQA